MKRLIAAILPRLVREFGERFFEYVGYFFQVEHDLPQGASTLPFSKAALRSKKTS
jgi:hypothetical protein